MGKLSDIIFTQNFKIEERNIIFTTSVKVR